jgi:predicted small lipoprotein YifL
MKWNGRLTSGSVMTLLILFLGLTGCPQKEGPAEHAGKEVDKAMNKAGQQIEKAGESVQDAAKGDKK